MILRDIFPQNAVDLGFISRLSAVYWAFRLLEKWTYAASDHIGCMSPGNIDYVRQHNSGLDDKKLHMLPNWIAERHVFAVFVLRVHVAEMLEAAAGNHDRQVAIGVGASVANAGSEEHDCVVEHAAFAKRLFD